MPRKKRSGNAIGGGSSKEEKAHQRRLEEIQRQQQQTQQQFLTLASQPDPLTERLRQRDLSWMDWSEGKSGEPIDVRRAPGLGPAISLFESAKRGQDQERMGIGALRMGAQGSDPNLSRLLTEQSQARREQDAAGQLENVVRTREAEVTGSILPLAGLQQQQRMGLASLASGNAQNTLNTMTSFVGRPRRRSFWQDLLIGGMGASIPG